MEDRCVICGEIIPEGSHVCKICSKKFSTYPVNTDSSQPVGDYMYSQHASVARQACGFKRINYKDLSLLGKRLDGYCTSSPEDCAVCPLNPNHRIPEREK